MAQEDRLGNLGKERRENNSAFNEYDKNQNHPPNQEGGELDTFAFRKEINSGVNEYSENQTYPENIEGDEIDTYEFRRSVLNAINEYDEGQTYPDNIEGDEIETYEFRRDVLNAINEYDLNETYPDNIEGDEIETYEFRRDVLNAINEYDLNETYPDNITGDEIDTYEFRRDINSSVNEYNDNQSYPDNITGDEIDTYESRRDINSAVNEYNQNQSYPGNVDGDEIETYEGRKDVNSAVNEYNQNQTYDTPQPELEDIGGQRYDRGASINDYDVNDTYSRNHPNAVSDGDNKGKGLNPQTLQVGSADDIQKLNDLVAGNLYAPNNVYDLNNPKLLEALGRVTDLLRVTTDIDLPAAIVDNLDNLFPRTPLTQIGIARYTQAIADRVSSNVLTDVAPRINIGAAVDDLFGEGGDNNDQIFVLPTDFEITKPSGLLKNIGFYLQEIAGTNFNRDIFSDKTDQQTIFGIDRTANQTNEFFLENSGKEQIRRLVKGVRGNVYAPYYEERRYTRFLGKYDNDLRNRLLESGDLRTEDTQTGYILSNKPLRSQYVQDPKTDEDFVKNSVNVYSEFQRQQNLGQEGFGADNLLTERLDQEKSRVGNVTINGVNGKLNEGSGGEIGLDDLADRDRDAYLIGKTGQNEEKNVQRGLFYYVNQVIDTNHPIKKAISQIPEERNACGYGSKSFAGPDNDRQYSRGINNIHCDETDRDNQVYCRSWTRVDQYNTFNKAVRNGTSYRNEVYDEGTFVNSTLHESGRPRIFPLDPTNFPDKESKDRNFKRLMLSIENLAWKGQGAFIPECELGPNGGRIMWFPPYNINWSESNTSSWEDNLFLGRPEPVYTYKNTRRSMTLGFSLIADYPSIINKVDREQVAEWELRSFNHGCTTPPLVPPTPPPTPDEINQLKIQIKTKQDELTDLPDYDVPEEYTPDPEDGEDLLTGKTEMTFYFENDVAEFGGLDGSDNRMLDQDGNEVLYESTSAVLYLSDYQSFGGFSYPIWDGGRGGTVSIGAPSNTYNAQVKYNIGLLKEIEQTNGASFEVRKYNGLNQDFVDNFDDLINTLNENEFTEFIVEGYASDLFTESYNKRLGEARAKSVKDLILSNVSRQVNNEIKIVPFGEPTGEEDDQELGTWRNIDNRNTKENRVVKVKIKLDQEKLEKKRKDDRDKQRRDSQNRNAEVEKDRRRIQNEITALQERLAELENSRKANVKCYYFQDIPSGDQPTFFREMRKRIDHFDPTFHSQTPEDLNKRMTFLHQCMRPGAPISGSTSAKNLLYGRSPFIVLRFGDFYYTRAKINSINFNYDNGIIWDLNPEGIGIQPMIVNVNMEIDLIGGSSLSEPINRLQNALSFNYYANTHVYEPTALTANPQEES